MSLYMYIYIYSRQTVHAYVRNKKKMRISFGKSKMSSKFDFIDPRELARYERKICLVR